MTLASGVLSKWRDEMLGERELSVGLGAQAFGALVVMWFVCTVVYNLYFHPLAKYPGPFWARASLLWRLKHSMSGRWHRVLEEQHKRYGDVFRVSPNELSFASAPAWKAIYTPKGRHGIAKIPKNEFYDVFGAGFDVQSMGTERDPKLAAQKRDLFSDALSVKGLAAQEGVIQDNVDRWVRKLGKLGGGKDGVDMQKWYIYFGFDLVGEMSFGESFGCVEREASHEWLDLMLGLLFVVNLGDNLRRFPLAMTIAGIVPSKWTNGIRDKLVNYGKQMTKQRLQKKNPQNDFLDHVAGKVHSGEVSEEEMAAHAWNMSLAGGETTGTSMAATTFYVLKTPGVLEKLQQEVRAAYKTYGDIDYASAMQLPYLMAVLKEGGRIFPTAPQGTPRKSPGVSIDGHYVPAGAEMYVSPWAVSHREAYFHEPYTFKPERWLDPDCKDVKDASQPFSLGPRVCPGKLFANAQMSLQLAKMVYLYDMELVDKELDWEPSCKMHFLWWKPDLRVRFTPREVQV